MQVLQPTSVQKFALRAQSFDYGTLIFQSQAMVLLSEKFLSHKLYFGALVDLLSLYGHISIAISQTIQAASLEADLYLNS